MIYFKLTVLILILSAKLSYAMDFRLLPSNKVEDTDYFTLKIKSDGDVKNIDVALEGNSKDVAIKQYYTFTCNWGNVTGVRLSMDSSSVDGPLSYDNIYAVDNKLNVVFAKSFSSGNNRWVDPISLNSSVCNRIGGGIKDDPITKKNYIVDFEAIQQGPFYLKGVDNVSIKYIRGELLELIREDVNGEQVIDMLKNHDGSAPTVRTVFFVSIKSEMNFISLISWGGGMDEGDYYKIYGYKYDSDGIIHVNDLLNRDPNLSGENSRETPFKYKNYSSIKTYLINKYDSIPKVVEH